MQSSQHGKMDRLEERYSTKATGTAESWKSSQVVPDFDNIKHTQDSAVSVREAFHAALRSHRFWLGMFLLGASMGVAAWRSTAQELQEHAFARATMAHNAQRTADQTESNINSVVYKMQSVLSFMEHHRHSHHGQDKYDENQPNNEFTDGEFANWSTIWMAQQPYVHDVKVLRVAKLNMTSSSTEIAFPAFGVSESAPLHSKSAPLHSVSPYVLLGLDMKALMYRFEALEVKFIVVQVSENKSRHVVLFYPDASPIPSDESVTAHIRNSASKTHWEVVLVPLNGWPGYSVLYIILMSSLLISCLLSIISLVLLEKGILQAKRLQMSKSNIKDCGSTCGEEHIP